MFSSEFHTQFLIKPYTDKLYTIIELIASIFKKVTVPNFNIELIYFFYNDKHSGKKINTYSEDEVRIV